MNRIFGNRFTFIIHLVLIVIHDFSLFINVGSICRFQIISLAQSSRNGGFDGNGDVGSENLIGKTNFARNEASLIVFNFDAGEREV